MTTRSPRRSGLTLLEMTAVMVLFSVVLLMSAAVLGVGFRAQRSANAALRLVEWRDALSIQFRSDVHRAESRWLQHGERKAGPDCLILRNPNGRFVVYQWKNQELLRIETQADGTEHQRPLIPSGAVSAVEVEPPSEGTSVIALRLREDRRHGPPRNSELVAAMGGHR